MVAEVLAGIALAKAAVGGIKSAIDTAKDVNDVAHFVDDLFKSHDQSRQAAKKAQKNILGGAGRKEPGERVPLETPPGPRGASRARLYLEERRKHWRSNTLWADGPANFPRNSV